MPQSNRTLGPRLYLILGVCGLIAAVVLAMMPQLLLHGAQVAHAQVVALRGNDADGFAPIIQFTEPNGGVVSWSGTPPAKPAEYKVGDSVRMVYLPENPAAIAIAPVWRLYLPAFASALFGMLFIAFGLLGRQAVLRARI